jgi:hypothetical protein
MFLGEKNFKDGKCPTAAPYLEYLLLSSGALNNFQCKTNRQKYLAFEPWTGTKCQLHAQG